MPAVENPKEAAGAAKLPLQLVPAAASRDMALALAHGAAKYGKWNWRDAGIVLSTYIGALRRHVDALAEGEWINPDSGLPHIAHILAGAAIVSDAFENDMIELDYPPQGDLFGGALDDAEDLEIDRTPHDWWKNLPEYPKVLGMPLNHYGPPPGSMYDTEAWETNLDDYRTTGNPAPKTGGSTIGRI